MKEINPQEFNAKDAYFFAISLIIPRPIAFVTSINKEGVINSAPFSYFNGLSTKPPLISISIANKKNAKKDTLVNILEKKEFCVNFVSPEMAEGITISAADFEHEDSELNYNGFSPTPSKKIEVPRLKEAKAALECKLVRVIDDLGPFSLVIGECVLYQVAEELIDSKTGYIDALKANFLGRLGGSDFCTIGDISTVKRKSVAEYKEINSK